MYPEAIKSGLRGLNFLGLKLPIDGSNLKLAPFLFKELFLMGLNFTFQSLKTLSKKEIMSSEKHILMCDIMADMGMPTLFSLQIKLYLYTITNI